MSKQDGKWALNVFVEERTNAHRWLDNLDNIEGMAINVVVTGVLESLEIDRAAKMRPAMAGISVGHPDITAGTLGAVVWDETKTLKYILSNNHVLANVNGAEIGDPIYQPGVYDGGTAEDTIAHLTQFSNIILGGWTDGINLIDAAIALIDNPDDATEEICEITTTGCGAIKTDIDVGDTVKKSGRTSGVNESTILYFSGVLGIQYPPPTGQTTGTRTGFFDDQIVTGMMAQGGDSGSLLLSEDNRPIGLLFAGSSVISLHNRIGYVFDEFNMLFTGDPPWKHFKVKYDIEEYQATLRARYDIEEWDVSLAARYHSGQTPFQIYTFEQLLWMSLVSDPNYSVYEQRADIDASATETMNWDETLGIYRGWKPKGAGFMSYNGNFFTIRNLHVNRPDEDNVGMFGGISFGGISFGTVQKVVLQEVHIIGRDGVGAIMGSGGFSMGTNTFNMSACSVTGRIEGRTGVGGLAGVLVNSTMSLSDFDGVVVSFHEGGGAVGRIYTSQITDCYAQGIIDLLPSNYFTGGFVGRNTGASTCARCWCSVFITAPLGVTIGGALAGFGDTSILTDCWWDSVVCNVATPDAFSATTDFMQIRVNFANWNFDTVWTIIQYEDYPRLKHGVYFAEAVECMGLADSLIAINLMGRFSELLGIMDLYQFVNLRDTLPEGMSFADKLHNLFEGFARLQEGIGFEDGMTVNSHSQRFLTPAMGLQDKCTLLNWTQFLAQNKNFFVERYYCYLEGPGGVPASIELPISSFQGRRRLNQSTYLGVVIPDIDYYQDIVDRAGGELSVYMGYELFGESCLRQLILQATLENTYYEEGANNASIQLNGHKTYGFSPKTVVIESVNYKRISNGLVTLRTPVIDLFLNPGDTVLAADEEIIVDTIAYNLSLSVNGILEQSMEVTEWDGVS